MAQQIVWDGISIDVEIEEFVPYSDLSRIQLKAEAPLPVTKTGYRNHYTQQALLAQFENPMDFVRHWLDECAKDPTWIKQKEVARQLSLF